MIPDKFGRYEIRSELAQGGMGIVYHAYDPKMDREVAIKVLPAQLMRDPKLRKRFEREARVVADLEHPALVPIHDFGEENEQLYLVMRYLTGGTLLDRLRKQPLAISEVERIIKQLAPAFDYVHQQGVIHRDVKPGNILFDQNDNAFLTDFGVVKLTAATTPLTTGTVLGTPHYMSPELAQEGGTVTHLVDIYALGVTIYQALTGELPYGGPGSSPVIVLMAHINEPTPDVRLLRPDLPEAVSEVIEKAMAKKPEERHQTVGELVLALSAAAKAPPSDSQPLPIPVKAPEAAAEASPEPSPVLPTRLEKAPSPATGPDMPDPEPILDILPSPFEWCEVPGKQSFSLETNEGNIGTYIISPFFIAKYQTTYEQVQVFINDPQGFSNPECWVGLEATLHHKKAPGSQHFTHAQNLPRENISWYDAVAFCRWLTSQIRHVGWEIRLPTEWEWQWAAQGPDGRAYPWGSDFDNSRCNTCESAIGKTTPVGSYSNGASLYGVLDMSGNVWEWCLNEYQNPYNVNVVGNNTRVVRGGSWYSDFRPARAAFRYRGVPNNRNNYFGFRVVCGFRPEL